MLDFILVRVLFVGLFAAAAAYFRPDGAPIWVAAVLGVALGGFVILAARRFERVSLSRLIGMTFGAVSGLVCAAFVSFVLGRLDSGNSATLHFVEIATLLLLIYLGAATGAAKGELLNLGALGGLFGAESETRSNQKILDTSVIIDGRIADVADTGFLDGVLVVPQFVLHELQMVADSADPMKRTRGRRGLDVLQRIQKIPHVKVQIVTDDFPDVKEVDMKLIELARLYNARIITNDFNLNKVAHLRGAGVLNINELVNSLKPIVLPGELMRVFILKEGKEYNQGVAYLDDGTMVVVDNARRMISRTIDITVTSVLQTTAGKMIFGKFDDRQQSASAGAGQSAASAAASGNAERRESPPRREQPVGEN